MNTEIASDKDTFTSFGPKGNQTSNPKTILCFVACVIGCLLGTILIHFVDPFFQLQYTKELGISPPPEEIQQYRAATRDYWVKNYSLNFAMLGGTLGLCAGFLTTSSRRYLSAPAGALVGSCIGALAAYASSTFVVEAILANSDQSLLLAVALHGSIWASMFGAIVFAIGLTQFDIGAALNGLLFGGILGFSAAIAYLIIFSFVFPRTDLTHLIPRTIIERITWALIIAIVLGAGLSFASDQLSSRGIRHRIAK